MDDRSFLQKIRDKVGTHAAVGNLAVTRTDAMDSEFADENLPQPTADTKSDNKEIPDVPPR